jgi:hypothetical protein
MKYFFLILLLVAIIINTGCIGEKNDNIVAPTSTPTTLTIIPLIPTVQSTSSNDSIIQIKNNALNISYNDLFRDNEKYIGKTAYFRGKIVQIAFLSGNEYIFRVATKKNQYFNYSDDIIYVNYQGSRYFEGDIIDLWGRVDGLEIYSAPWSNTVSFPKITGYYAEFVMKAPPYSNTSTTISLKPVY